jgi:hypothetical protein
MQEEGEVAVVVAAVCEVGSRVAGVSTRKEQKE